MTTYWSTDDIRRAHHGHEFDPSSMRFFRSRIRSAVYQGLGGVFFVSSEQFHNVVTGATAPRLYTVRQYDPVADSIRTVGEFNSLTYGTAHRTAKRCAVNGLY